MSILSKAQEEAEHRWAIDREESAIQYPPDALSYHARGAFIQGVQWLLAHLTDPDQATMDAVAQGMFADFWRRDGMLPMPGESTTWDGNTDEIRDEWREDARAAITALTNHLNGDQS